MTSNLCKALQDLLHISTEHPDFSVHSELAVKALRHLQQATKRLKGCQGRSAQAKTKSAGTIDDIRRQKKEIARSKALNLYNALNENLESISQVVSLQVDSLLREEVFEVEADPLYSDLVRDQTASIAQRFRNYYATRKIYRECSQYLSECKGGSVQSFLRYKEYNSKTAHQVHLGGVYERQEKARAGLSIVTAQSKRKNEELTLEAEGHLQTLLALPHSMPLLQVINKAGQSFAAGTIKYDAILVERRALRVSQQVSFITASVYNGVPCTSRRIEAEDGHRDHPADSVEVATSEQNAELATLAERETRNPSTTSPTPITQVSGGSPSSYNNLQNSDPGNFNFDWHVINPAAWDDYFSMPLPELTNPTFFDEFFNCFTRQDQLRPT